MWLRLALNEKGDPLREAPFQGGAKIRPEQMSSRGGAPKDGCGPKRRKKVAKPKRGP